MSDICHIPWHADEPIVSVTISEPDLMTVHVFGLPFHPPAELLPLTRASFGQVMDLLWDQYRQPLSVQIIETDGSKQTGIIDLATSQLDSRSDQITPAVLPPNTSQPVDVTGTPLAPRQVDKLTPPPVIYPTQTIQEADWVRLLDTSEPDLDEPITLTGQPVMTTDTAPGQFWPGEQINIGWLAGVTTADQDGQPRADIPSWLAGQVFFIGATSGAVGTATSRY